MKVIKCLMASKRDDLCQEDGTSPSLEDLRCIWYLVRSWIFFSVIQRQGRLDGWDRWDRWINTVNPDGSCDVAMSLQSSS